MEPKETINRDTMLTFEDTAGNWATVYAVLGQTVGGSTELFEKLRVALLDEDGDTYRKHVLDNIPFINYITISEDFERSLFGEESESSSSPETRIVKKELFDGSIRYYPQVLNQDSKWESLWVDQGLRPFTTSLDEAMKVIDTFLIKEKNSRVYSESILKYP